MSRTKRSKELNSFKCRNWKTKSVAHIKEGQQTSYWVGKSSLLNKEDLYDELYIQNKK